MASRQKEKRPFSVGSEVVGQINNPAGPAQDPIQEQAGGGGYRRGSRQQRQDAAVGVDVGQLRNQAVNQMRSIEPLTINPNQVQNSGAEGERRVEVKKRGVGDALKNFQ